MIPGAISYQPNNLNKLWILTSQVSLEAMHVADVGALVKNVFPDVVGLIKDFFNRFMPSQPAIEIKVNKHDFYKLLEEHSYMDIAPLAAYVPEGMDVSYREYVAELAESAEHAAKVITEVLNPYTVFLAQIISHNDARLATRDKTFQYKEFGKRRDRLNSEIGECFQDGSNNSEVTYGDVVARNGDWAVLFGAAENLFTKLNSVNRTELNKKIKECDELLETIIKRANAGDMEGISPETLSNLSTGAYNVASELEFFGITVYRAMAFANAVDRTAEHVIGALKK